MSFPPQTRSHLPVTIPSPAKKLCFNEISRGNFIARNQEAEIEDFSEKHREVWRGCEDKRKKKKEKEPGKREKAWGQRNRGEAVREREREREKRRTKAATEGIKTPHLSLLIFMSESITVCVKLCNGRFSKTVFSARVLREEEEDFG